MHLHWTLIVLLALCAIDGALNLAAAWLARSLGAVRVPGVLVCAGWLVQQWHWWRTGGDSLALFVACDAAIVGWFLWAWRWRGRRFTRQERLIALSIPFTTALGAFAWLNGGHTWWSWWANVLIVMAQMLVGLPMPRDLARRAERAAATQADPFADFERRRHEPAA